MTLLIGTDEAGYGPNLGPLVVSASVWHLNDQHSGTRDRFVDLYERLAPGVAPQVDSSERVAICDSKQLYHSGEGLGKLEHGVLSCLQAIGSRPTSWQSLCVTLAPETFPDAADLPWYARYDETVPIMANDGAIARGSDLLQQAAADAAVALRDIRSRIVTARMFNRRLDDCGNKSTLLSEVTLQLLADVIARHTDDNIWVRCDKHGGRNYYAGVLQHTFPDMQLSVIRESREISEYELRGGATRITIQFCAKGESFLPTALASMASKYLRELSMRAFNSFWLAKIPGLRPTAGYPVDAKRFLHDIQQIRQQLEIADEILWRQK